MSGILSVSFKCVGTQRGEILNSRNEYLAAAEKLFLVNQYFDFSLISSDEDINENCAVVIARYNIVSINDARDKWYVRISASMQLFRGDLKITSIHYSLPDSAEPFTFPGSSGPQVYDEVSILFCDIVNFTRITESISANGLVERLNDMFYEFDLISGKCSVFKIKTIGDAYMGVSGLSGLEGNHAKNCIQWSRRVLEFLQVYNRENDIDWKVRIGVHTGSVVGGFIGFENRTFDIWGDAVNVASRMEKASEPNQINISRPTYDLVKDEYSCTYRGEIDVKGKYPMGMYFVDFQDTFG